MKKNTKLKALIPCLLSLALTGSGTTYAATNEQTLTVAFLYNFMKFTEWPNGVIKGEMTLCVADSATFGSELDGLNGRSAQDKTVRVRRVDLSINPRECQILFLPREEKPVRIKEWLAKANQAPTLMVSNLDEFLDMGGMIVLIENESRLKFEVDLKRVREAGLGISSQMLQIASEVHGK